MKNAQSTYRATGSAAHRITAALCLSVLCMVMLLAVSGTALAEFDYANWMKYLPDNMLISQINIPGTHDSGTSYMNICTDDGVPPFGNKHSPFYDNAMKFGSTQDLNIRQQLEHGLRVLDLRLAPAYPDKDENYELPLCHGVATCMRETQHGLDVPLHLNAVIQDDKVGINAFLDAHPSETVIIIVNGERGDDTDWRIGNLMTDHHHLSGKNRHWEKVVAYDSGEAVPKLGDVRGKIVMIRDDHKSYTEYEMQYKYYGDNPVTVEDKVNILKTIVDDAKANNWRIDPTGKQEDRFKTSKYSFKTQKGDPNTPKIIGTNLTKLDSNFKDVMRTIVDPAKSLAYRLWKQFPYTNTQWPIGYRYGWITMDVPPDSVISSIARTNYVYPMYEYEVHFRFNLREHPEFSMIREEHLKNGLGHKVENVMNDEWAKPTVFKLSSWSPFGGSLTYKSSFAVCPTSSDLAPEKMHYYPLKFDLDTQTYKPELISRTVKTYSDHLDNGCWGKIVEIYEIGGQANEKIDVAMPDIYWDDNHDAAGLRPKTMEEFLENIGKPRFWVSVDRDTTVETLTSTTGKEYVSRDFKTKQDQGYDVWCGVHAVFARYGGREYSERKFEFNGLEEEKRGRYRIEYKPKADGSGNAIFLHLTDDIWVDAPDITLITVYDTGLINGAIRELKQNVTCTAYATDPFRTVFTKTIDASKVSIEMEKIDEFLVKLHVKASVPVENADINGQLHYQFSYKKDLQSYDGDIPQKPNTYVMITYMEITVNWDDSHNIDNLRPSDINVSINGVNKVTKRRWGTNTTIDATEHRVSEDQWKKVIRVPVYQLTDPYESMDYSARDSRTQPLGGYREQLRLTPKTHPLVLTITYTRVGGDFADIQGKGYWNDGDLNITHENDDIDIKVLKDGTAWLLRDAKLKLQKGQKEFEYSFEPNTDFPHKIDGVPVVYTANPVPKDGYIIEPYSDNGNDFVYTRAVSISGDVTWKDGNIPDPNVRPTVTLLRDGTPVGDPVKCDEDYHYSFDGWPIADVDTQTAPYRYSIKAEMPESAHCVITYDPVERNTTTGNFTANAKMQQTTQDVYAEIPVKLTLQNIDPDLVPEIFDFELTCLEDDSLSGMIALGSMRNFEGTFTTPALPDHNKTYTFRIRQLVYDYNEKAYWTYDRNVLKATVQVVYLEDTPAATVQFENGANAAEFTNVYHAEDGVLALTAKKEIDYTVEAGGVVPETDFAYLLEAVLEDNTRESVAKVYHTLDGQIVFPRLAYQNAGTYKYIISEPEKDIPGWEYDEHEYPVTVTVTNQDNKLVATADKVPVFKNTFAYQTQTVNVSVNWIDKDSKRRPSQMQIQLLANGSAVADTSATLESKTNWTYKYPGMPTNIGQKAIRYGVDVVVPSGYSARVTGNAVDGFVINCTAMIEVSGTVDWENKDRPTHAQPIIQLTRNEMPYGQPLVADSYGYKFTDLPIADEDNQPYRYAITATMPSYPCAIFYDQPKQNPDTGFVQADAIIRKILGTIKVKLNKKIDNKMAGIAQPPEETFNFQMQEVQSDGSRALVSTASITGEGTVEFPEMGFTKTGTFNLVLSETSEEKAGWIYDKQEYPVKLKANFRAGELIVEQDAEPTVTNTFVTTMTEVPVRVVWNIGSDNCTVPDSVEMTLRSDSGEEFKATVSAAQEWSYTFTDVKQYRLNGETLEPIQYTLFATDAQGFEKSISSSLGVYQVTYTQNTKIDIPVSAEWDFTHMNMDDVPDALSVTLKDITDSEEGETVAMLSLFKSNLWQGKFKNIDEFVQPVSSLTTPVSRAFTLEVGAVDLFKIEIIEENGSFRIVMHEAEHAGIEDITLSDDNAMNAQIVGDLNPFLEKGEDRYEVQARLDAKELTALNEAEDALLRKALGRDEKVLAMMDITAWKKVENRSVNNDWQQLHQMPGGEITVQVDLPMPYANDSKMLFDVIRIHNGKAERIPCTQDHVQKTITFRSDKFSTYVITGRKIPDLPQTGDDSNLPLMLGALALSLTGLAMLCRKRKVF